jgi:hypothetical protein
LKADASITFLPAAAADDDDDADADADDVDMVAAAVLQV